MIRNITYLIAVVIITLIVINVFHRDEYYNLKQEELKQSYSVKEISSVDHSKFEILKTEFQAPQEVTEACLSCHTERHKEVMQSSHWNWERVSYIEGRGLTATGKKNVLNNFCIGSNSNEQSCAKCHIGFGMTNDHYDFTNKRNVDCMVCHDNSDEYMKGSAMAGYPARDVNLNKVAQHVGNPTKANCGSCHFYSGGGNNVKHGDLEEAQLSCDREVDVHMASNGINMECVACHTAENHAILGKLYSVSSDNSNRATCEQCHSQQPHFSEMLNRHNAKVACQTCHIPTYAKENATKMSWKWSDAGKLKDGKAYHEDDTMGNHSYLSIKGSFTWEKDVKPDYAWFNGTADHYILGDTVSTFPIQMNTLFGSHKDIHSKIIPVKIHVGDQIYDPVNKLLIQPKLYAPQKGDSAFWVDFNWETAAKAGMDNAGLPYSGQHEFVRTEMYWPINHMVSPKEQSLTCAECHTRSDDGRLAKLTGFYLPGRDYNKWVDNLGEWMFFAALFGVFIHSIIRIVVSIRNKKYETQIIDYDKDDNE